MIDTIKIGISIPEQEIQKVIKEMNEPKGSINWKTKEKKIEGTIGNMKCVVKSNYLFAQGSLPKFYFGTNLKTLTLSATKEAVEKLSDKFGMELQGANLYGVHFGENFEMTEPCHHYMPLLATVSKMNKSVFKTGGILFYNKRKALEFYDKIAESITKKYVIPEEFLKIRHLLRYEMKLNNKLRMQLGEVEISLSDIYKESLYGKLLSKYKQEYSRIKKIQNIEGVLSRLRKAEGTKDFVEYLALSKISELGVDILLDSLKIDMKQGNIERQRYNRMRAKVLQLCQTSLSLTEHSLVEELDKRVMSLEMI